MASTTPGSKRIEDGSATGKQCVPKASLSALLDEPAHPALVNVACEVVDSKVILEGEVPTFYLKQLAQETAARIRGIQTVENKIQVKHARVGGK